MLTINSLCVVRISYNQWMGTILFWLTWLAVFCFFKLTSRQQRKRWEGLLYLAATVCLCGAATLNFTAQGYLTVV